MKHTILALILAIAGFHLPWLFMLALIFFVDPSYGDMNYEALIPYILAGAVLLPSIYLMFIRAKKTKHQLKDC